MISKQDLELISYDELKNELCSRYDSVLFVGQKTIKADYIDYHYSGGKTTCMGLCDLIKNQIIKDFNDETRPKLDKENDG